MAKEYECSRCDAKFDDAEAYRRHMFGDHSIFVTNLPQRDPLLEERQKTHGDFVTNAEISQGLKAVMRRYNSEVLTKVHREALDMIALKLSRILSGQANYADHWDDIAGYAKLASEACQKSQ